MGLFQIQGVEKEVPPVNDANSMSPIPQGFDQLLHGRRSKGLVAIFNQPFRVVKRIKYDDLYKVPGVFLHITKEIPSSG